MKKNFILSLVLVLGLGVSAVSAQKQAGSRERISAAPGSPVAGTVADGTPDSMVSIDITGTQSWDLRDDPNNDIIIEAIGAGAIVTGVGGTVAATTVGASWQSEAETLWEGCVLLTWCADPICDGPGSFSSSTGGILDLTDNGISNCPADASGNMVIQFYETFDDVADAVDLNYTAGSIELAFMGGAPVPTMPRLGSIALVIILLSLGTLLLRHRARQS